MVNSDQHFLRKNYWWQSEPGVENVTIQLNLESTFELDFISVTFKYTKPHSMVMEKSSDGGKSWSALQYFSYDCFRVFPTVPNLITRAEGEPYCEQRFSDSSDVESAVVFKVEDILDGAGVDESSGKELKMVTNVRIRLIKFHALPYITDATADKLRYFYSISQLEIGGKCFCNGHASKCVSSDPYEAFVSDKVYGVCQCAHFTQGTNCDSCKPMYNALEWKPWTEQNQFECRECKCNNHASVCRFNQTQRELSMTGGSSSRGEGDGGQCVNCDDETEGAHCDRCRVGYHLQLGRLISDRFPCRMCDYDPRGVTGEICDPKTGKVFCKPKVTGPRCDTCVEGTYGLGYGSVEGCMSCECAPGGSRTPACDSRKSGKCDCRYGFTGQKCEQVESGSFIPTFDHFRLEAESSQSNARKIIMKQYGLKTWTGDGFVELRSGETLKFEISSEQFPRTSKPLLFIPFLRVKPIDSQHSFTLSMRTVLGGKESERRSMGSKWTTLCQAEYGIRNPSQSTSVEVNQQNTIWGWLRMGDEMLLCLQMDIPVQIILSIDQSKSGEESLSSLEIDSLILAPYPKGTSVGDFGLSEEDIVSSYCIEQQMSLLSGPLTMSKMNDKCRQYTIAVQAELYNGAKSCDCNKFGTKDGSQKQQCEPMGGQCGCKTNVIGRQCDQCLLGTYNITHKEGCQDCSCNMLGTKPGTFCDPQTGDCQCLPGFSGKNCDECEEGRFGFPKCDECQCNGKSASCDPESGKCLECTQHSAGFNCELCEDGYYLDATNPEVSATCRACSCPGTFQDSLNKSIAFFASGCTVDSKDSSSVRCSCLAGYKGDLCTECAPGYFGNPAAGIQCRECECHGNELDPVHKCDSRSGVCLGCRNSADGDKCDRCKEGFFGDPTDPTIGCSACRCDRSGTLDKTCGPSGCSCDDVTGSCYCKPNVIGAECSQCAANHFNISHPDGCQPCECASYGSRENMCDPVTGFCACLPYYGGRKCDECGEGEWGDPLDKCHSCDCNPWGSNSNQCSRYSGQCECRTGVRGQKCDECEIGYQGTFPACEPCGSCYDNWKLIMDDLKRESDILADKAAKIEKSGSVGEYTREFQKLDGYIRDIEKLLESNKEAADRLKQLKDTVESSKLRADLLEEELVKYEASIETQSGDLDRLRLQLDQARRDMNESSRRIEILKAKKDGLAADSLLGIKDRISKASEMSKQAMADSLSEMESLVSIEKQLDYIERQLTLIDPTQYQETVEEFQETFEELETQVNSTQVFIAEMTKLMCGGVDPTIGSCDTCGGPRCSFCGNTPTAEGIVLATCKGATTYSRKAESKLKEIIALLDAKLTRAREVLQEVNEALSLVEITSLSAEDLRRRAEDAQEMASNLNKTFTDQLTSIAEQKALSYRYLDDVSKLLKAIDNFQMPNITQKDIENLEREMRSMEAQVDEMAKVTQQMQANASLVRTLLQDALTARKLAESVMSDVMKLMNMLTDAVQYNNLTEQAINDTKLLLSQMGAKVDGLRSDMAGLDKLVNQTADSLKSVLQCRDTLASLMSSLTVELSDAEAVVNQANATVAKTGQDADDLREDFDRLEQFLDDKITETNQVSQKAEDALEHATELTDGAQEVFDRFQSLNRRLFDQIRKFRDYGQKIDALNNRLEDAWEKIRYQYKLKYDPQCTKINFPESL
ncbi:laminin subunit beta-1-like [Convolutriloba macropyga]|uniref:laminin subunit beta-1-like n=1 Tax=Convolutriloba macropyga TaxID=536237 RepID=UPI003F51C7FF